MARFYPVGGGWAGSGSSDVTATSANVEVGKTAITSDSGDEPKAGTLRNISKDNPIDFAVGNSTPVIDVESTWCSYYGENADGVKRAMIQFNRDRGVIEYGTILGVPEARMASTLSLTPNKLAQGQSVLGVTGTYKGLGNAVATDVRKGKTFSTAALSNASGTMPEQGAATITPSTANQTIAANRYLTGAQTILGDANLVAANIKKGVTIFGKTGTWEGYDLKKQMLYAGGTWGISIGASGGAVHNSGGWYISSGYGKLTIPNTPLNFNGHKNFMLYAGKNTPSDGSSISPYIRVRIKLNATKTWVTIPTGATVGADGEYYINVQDFSGEHSVEFEISDVIISQIYLW